jgi:4'-phosphopantetheinyl transferase
MTASAISLAKRSQNFEKFRLLKRRPSRRTSLSLARDTVHLWFAELEASAERVLELERSLSSDEIERANRFKFPRDRCRFIVGRGLLRWLLGHYLYCKPRVIRFAYGPFGKPSLVQQSGSARVCFNLSHAGSLAVLAFVRGREIGVDIEQVDVTIDFQQMATQFFAPREIADIMMRPADQRHARFFELWTRKEALIKAHGKGLSTGLDKLHTLSCDDGPTDSAGTGAAYRIEPWSLRQFWPALGYVAALAVSGAAYRLYYHEVKWITSGARFTKESCDHAMQLLPE